MGEDGPTTAVLPVGLDETAARWKVLRAHDYFGYAAEAVLKSWLAYLKRTEEADATLEKFKQQARSGPVCERIADRIGRSTLTPDTPLSTVLVSLWPDATPTTLQDETTITPIPMTHAASEYTLDAELATALSGRDWTRVHATWSCLLLALSLRFAAPSGTDATA